MIQRFIEPQLQRLAAQFPVITITGPRQSGKTTLAQHHFKNYDYVNLEKRQNDSILKEKLPRSVGAQYATGDQWRNNSRRNEGMEPKQKEY